MVVNCSDAMLVCIFVCCTPLARAPILYRKMRAALSLWCSQSTAHAFCQSKERAAAVFYGYIVEIWFYNKSVEKYEYFLRQHSSGQRSSGGMIKRINALCCVDVKKAAFNVQFVIIYEI
jgi:hypothetical protein